MKIKKLIATFGRFQNEKLTLSPGLNVIEAPNEHGKSTWCGFLSAMLYGIDTSERDRNGHLSAKTRFRPWSGAEMKGTMELTLDGRDITLQRTGKSASLMKQLAAFYTGTADFVPGLTPETVGETVTGVTRDVFERTAFITRPELRVNQTTELEKRISSLVSTGDEGTSYTETDQLLRSWQRRLRHNRTGVLPALEEQLREVQQKADLLESSSEDIANLRSNMERYQKQIEALEQDLVIHDKLSRRAAYHRLLDAEQAARASEERVNALTEALTKNGHLMTRADVKGIREAAASVIPLKTVAQDAERNLWKAEKALSDAAVKRSASPLSGQPQEAVEKDIAEIRGLEERVKAVKVRKIPKWVPTLITVAAALALLVTSGLLTPFAQWLPALAPFVATRIWGIVVSALALAAGIALFFVKLPQPHRDADALRALLERYAVASSGKLEAMLASYNAICREEEKARVERDSARLSYENASAAAEAASAEAVARLSAFMPEVTSGEAVVEALNETERLIDKLTHAEFDMISSQNIYETLKGGYDGGAEVDEGYLPTPLRSREDTKAAIERTKAQLSDATRAFDLATGAQRTLGDPVLIRGELQMLRDRLQSETEKYNALTLAVEVLEDANTELSTRFSPLVSRRAGEIFARLTDGRYEQLLFDKGFNAGAREKNDTVSRNVLALSEGTADAVYFALRLAMCELILDGSDPCAIVLDGALESFDDERCKRALDLLCEMARRRQILLFTCHSRERALLQDRPDVNFIRL